MELSSGDVQVTDSGEADGQPIVLLHGYANSLHWFDAIEPLLAENHRVIRIDLLGFGGSEKPESGYSIPEQASTVAEALIELDVQGALVAGNSMGGAVTASLAEQASQLVDRAVMIDMAPNATTSATDCLSSQSSATRRSWARRCGASLQISRSRTASRRRSRLATTSRRGSRTPIRSSTTSER